MSGDGNMTPVWFDGDCIDDNDVYEDADDYENAYLVIIEMGDW